jgi:hypothetical protein
MAQTTTEPENQLEPITIELPFAHFVLSQKAILAIVGGVAAFLMARGYISKDESTILATVIMALLGIFNPSHRQEVVLTGEPVNTNETA